MTGRIGLALVVAGGLIGCSGSSDDAALVVQECKDAVVAQLAYPNDADFPFFDPNPSKDATGTWHVDGTVKAKNGLGATHTVRWTCTVDADDNVRANLDL
jgi:hypothetical protein